MGLLTTTVVTPTIEEGAGKPSTVETRVQVTKLIVLGALALAFGTFAFVLYLTDHAGPAGAMLAVTTAILGSGFGVIVGEKSGASSAVDALKSS